MTEQITQLPDGSGVFTASFPLPKDHWLYAPRSEGWDAVRDTYPDTPHPILTHAVRDAVVAAIRYAVRGATMCGQESDFDPDALVQNAVYALCGPFGMDAAPVAGAHPDKGTSALAAPVVPAPQVLERAHELGFLRCAGWAQRDDLFSDVTSQAYRKDRSHDLATITTPPQAAPVAQLSEPPASAALMRILKIVQDYVPPDGTPIEEAMSQIIACVDPWPDTGFTQFDDLLDDAAEWSGYVEVDTAPYGLKRHLKEVFEKYGITAAAPTTPKDSE